MTYPDTIKIKDKFYKQEVLSPVYENGTITNNIPAGYELAFTKEWGDPLMSAEGDFDLRKRYPDDRTTGTFQIINLYTEELSSWDGIACYNKLTKYDMIKIARAQLLADGKTLSETEYLNLPLQSGFSTTLSMQRTFARNLETPLSDGFSLKQKMGWMYNSSWGDGTSRPALVMWGYGEFWEDGEKRYGVMLSGEEPVLVSKERITMFVRLRGELTKRNVVMRKVHRFLPQYLSLLPNKNFGLWQHATCVYLNNAGEHVTYKTTPLGKIYLPVVLNPHHYDFAGQTTPQEAYIPENWLVFGS